MARAGVRIVWNTEGFREARTSPEAQEEIDRRAQAIADTAGPGYVTEGGTTGGRGRGRAVVITGDFDAILDNARHQTLIRSLDAGRG